MSLIRLTKSTRGKDAIIDNNLTTIINIPLIVLEKILTIGPVQTEVVRQGNRPGNQQGTL